MPGIDWTKRKTAQTHSAMEFTKTVDFPCILLVILYADNSPPAHYLIDMGNVKPISRKQSLSITGMVITFDHSGVVSRSYA